MEYLVQSPTNDLAQSKDFYYKLGFEITEAENSIFAADKQVCLEINPDRFARAGIKLYAPSWQAEARELERLVPIYQQDNGYIITDTSGSWIYLIESATGPTQPEAPRNTCLLGSYAGLSLEVISIAHSAEIWQILGLQKAAGDANQGWLSMNHDCGLGISLMKPNSCPHLFFNPSLTYFNAGNNPEIISKIREVNVSITEEITHFSKDGSIDNIIIRDPGGFGFFIFND